MFFLLFLACLTPSGLQNRLQMAIMSKIETTSKVSLKLPSRINLGRRGARARRALDLDTAHKILTALKGLTPG